MRASSVRWSVDAGSAIFVQFHPASEPGADAQGCIDPLQVRVLDVLLEPRADLYEGLFVGDATPRRLRTRSNAADDVAGFIKDRIAVEVIEVPARSAGLLGELTGVRIECRECVAQEDAASSLLRTRTATKHPTGQSS